MLEKLLVELSKRVDQITTLSTKKINWVKSVDKGIQVETETSREKFNKGQKNEPYEFISFDFISQGWKEFTSKRIATANDFEKTRGRSSFLMAFFSLLPFVETSNMNGSTVIHLIKFKTDDLPSEPFQNAIEFLNEIIEGKYHPEKLGQEIKENNNLLRIKSGARQDLRLIGLINDDNTIHNANFNQFIHTEDRIGFLRNQIKEKEYFSMGLKVLDILRNVTKNEKKVILEKIGMLVVFNSLGDNLMVESVAKKRTANLLKWLENVKLIDQDWIPNETYMTEKMVKDMASKLREYFFKIMNEYIEAKRESFGGNPLGSFVRRTVTDEIKGLPFIPSDQYMVNGSVGQGNWASIPWIAVMNKDVTVSTQRGYYIVYLFSEDMERLYLTFAQGVTETSKEEMERIKKDIRYSVPMNDRVRKDDDIYLGISQKAKQYVFSTAAYIQYDRENLPEEDVLVSDLEKMIHYYEEYIKMKKNSAQTEVTREEQVKENEDQFITSENLVNHIYSYIKSKGFHYKKEEVTNLYLSLKTKPFVILSGISGTGKTKMVQWFAESLGATEENGQFQLIPIRPDWNDGSDLLGYKDIKGDFIEGPLTKIINRASHEPRLPFFVLLDEMNLARVEYYFSDILSVMESKKWKDGEIVSSTLLSTEMTGYENDVKISNNLYIIGTVNMDETTHPFSKKVLDRANTIEFNRVELTNLHFLQDLEEVAPIPVWNDKLASTYLHLKDVYGEHQELVETATAELEKINAILQKMNAHVGYRVRDEICFYLAYNKEDALLKDEEAMDHCILQKILPRIAGSDQRVEELLKELYRIFTNQEYVNGDELDFEKAKYPNSARKVAEMLGRLTYDGFTSFWIS